MTSLRQDIFKYKDDHPREKPKEVISKFPGENEGSIRTYIKQWSKSNIPKTKGNIPKNNTKSTINPPQTEPSFIDDPDELLLSVAIRELNKPDPDPRWASILINCKKEKITNKGAAVDQFKSLPTQALVNLLNKSLQEEY